uniref:Bromo domain-containing protein n=1 Tax=Lygus hesperus TaxID=30085 RepID=A0A0A9XAJ0_LYGHE
MKVDPETSELVDMDDADYAEFETKYPRQVLWVDDGTNVRQTAWWKICNKLLKNLLREKDSKPFREPVDPIALNILDYHTYIKHPMDLGTIEKRLMAIPCQYTNPHDFINDVRMVFRNCYVYNKRHTYVCICV